MAYIRSKKTGRINVIEPSEIELFLLNPDIELVDVSNGVVVEEEVIGREVEEKREITLDWTKKEIVEYLKELGIEVSNPMMKKKEDLIKLIK